MKIGILGGGQLARMMALAAYPMGIHTLCYDPSKEACASDVTTVIQGDFTDEEKLKAFAEGVDCITFETENIPLHTASFLEKLKPVRPSLQTLAISQDRWHEKTFFNQLKIPTAQFFQINSYDDLITACKKIGYPAILKTRTQGYDGKGQYILRNEKDLAPAWEQFQHHTLILEAFVNFKNEVSMIAVRNAANEIKYYPLVLNQHKNGILRLSTAPFINSKLEQQAKKYAKKVLLALDYIGVLTIEFFNVKGRLIANEMAPRVHNSGHWTIEAATTSQFQNHLRAILNLPLGATSIKQPAAMLNCIGTEPAIQKILSFPNAAFHTYQKQARPLRKLGHITVTNKNKKALDAEVKKLQRLISE